MNLLNTISSDVLVTGIKGIIQKSWTNNDNSSPDALVATLINVVDENFFKENTTMPVRTMQYTFYADKEDGADTAELILKEPDFANHQKKIEVFFKNTEKGTPSRFDGMMTDPAIEHVFDVVVRAANCTDREFKRIYSIAIDATRIHLGTHFIVREGILFF